MEKITILLLKKGDHLPALIVVVEGVDRLVILLLQDKEAHKGGGR